MTENYFKIRVTHRPAYSRPRFEITIPQFYRAEVVAGLEQDPNCRYLWVYRDMKTARDAIQGCLARLRALGFKGPANVIHDYACHMELAEA